MLTGPAQVPLTLMSMLGSALAATVARDSPRVQLTVTVGLNCPKAGTVTTSSEVANARYNLVRLSIGVLLRGELEGPNAAGEIADSKTQFYLRAARWQTPPRKHPSTRISDITRRISSCKADFV